MLENASQNFTCDFDVLQELGVQHRSVAGPFFLVVTHFYYPSARRPGRI